MSQFCTCPGATGARSVGTDDCRISLTECVVNSQANLTRSAATGGRRGTGGESLDEHLSIHHHPVARECAEERIAAFFCWGMKIDLKALSWRHDVGIGQHGIADRDVAADGGLGVGDEL